MLNRKNFLQPERTMRFASLSDDLLMTVAFGGLGALFSYFSVEIPNTEVYFDVRQIFALMAFALLSRWWLALLVAMIVSVAGFHQVPTSIAFFGNLLFLGPTIVVVRLVHGYYLSRLKSLQAYGIGWFVLVLLCYQALTTPGLWGLIAFFRDIPIFPMVLTGWVDQPFLIESLLVAIVSASGMTAVRAHRELIQSRRELTTTLDSIGDGVIVTDIRGRIVRMNPVAQKLCGVSLEEAMGAHLDDVFHIVNSQTMKPVKNPVQTVLRNGMTVGLANHTSLISKDGTIRQIADSAAPIRLEDGSIIGTVMVFRDVTGEYEIREMLEISRDIIERSPVVAFMWKNQEGWPVEYASYNVKEMFGYSAEDFKNGAILYYKTIHPDDVARVDEEIKTAIVDPNSDTIPHQSYRIVTRMGEIKWVRTLTRIRRTQDGDVSGFDGIIIDITELKLAEQRYLDLFNTSMDMVFLSTVDGRFLDINPVAEEFFGYSLDELLTIDVQDIYYNPEDRNKFREDIERKGFVKNYPLTMKKKDGSPIDTIVSAVVIRGPDEKVVGYQGITKDISKLRKTQEQLFRAQKMEAIGTLAGGIAHDFNNILATIMGYASHLKTKTAGNDAVQKGLDAIEKSSIRAADLTSQLLTYTRLKTKEVKAVDLNRVINEVYRLVSKTLEKNIQLDMNLDQTIPTVEGDESQLFQVIMNIVLNAQAAMENGGVFNVETKAMHVDKPIEKDLFTIGVGQYVSMCCTDTGSGMDRETLLRVFEPYFSTRKKSGGSGLGMSVAFGIIKGHGGYIDIESEPGRGTCVTVLLPASTKHEELTADHEAEVTGGSETIMVIDDEHDVLSMTKTILSEYGYTVHVYNTGKWGIQAYSDLGADLVILDLKMPDMDGREVFSKLREIDPDVTILFSTGYAGPDIHQKIMKMGAQGYLEKPFVINTLLAKIREVLDESERGKGA